MEGTHLGNLRQAESTLLSLLSDPRLFTHDRTGGESGKSSGCVSLEMGHPKMTHCL